MDDSANTGEVPLNLANLRVIAAGTAREDKGRLVHAFVDSQRFYLNRYAEEGQAVAATWDRTPKKDNPGRDSTGEVLVTAFDTPILKPRVPEAPQPEREVVRVHDSDGMKSARAKDMRGKKHASRSTSRKENASDNAAKRVRKEDPSKDSRDHDVILRQQTLHRYAMNKQSHAECKRTSKKRQHSPDCPDPEHAARLAERRVRRRAKRAIVHPKAPSVQSSEDDDHASRNGKTKKERKKKRSTSLAAGLALMHGFTAKNIGKNRLTSKPEQRTGVFNKGKASSKVAVKTSRKHNSGAGLFSESRFLGKENRYPRAQSVSSEGGPADCSASSASNSTSDGESALPPPKKKGKSTVKTSKGPGTRGPSTERSEDVAQYLKVSRGTGRIQDKKSVSIVWDIEVDDKSLPSGSGSCDRVEDEEKGTVVLNTQSTKWATVRETPDSVDASQPKNQREAERNTGLAKHRINVDMPADKASAVSLRPSESASQVPQRFVLSPFEPALSRFFPAPALEEKARDIPEDQDLPVLPPSQTENVLDSHSHTASQVQQSPAPEAVASFPSPCHTLRASPASLSALDRELQALDDDDQGLVHALRSQKYAGIYADEVPLSVISESLLNWHAPLPPNQVFTSSVAGSGPDPGASTFPVHSSLDILGFREDLARRGDRSDYDRSMLEHHDVDAYSDQEELYEDFWQGTADHPGCEPGHFLEQPPSDALTYLEADFPDDVVYTPVLEQSFDETTFDVPYEAYWPSIDFAATEDSDLDAETSSRPQTPNSWSSTAPETSVSRATSVALSDVSTSLVPRFPQGRDLLLGLSENDRSRSAQYIPYSITSVEEDVARSLRGHWLPQRL